MTAIAPTFDHVLAMTDRWGTYEHAEGSVARADHGYCTDDVARVLILASREPDPSPAVRELARTSLRFLADAQDPLGRSRNRRAAGGRWLGRYGVDDCWGRSLWAFGVASAQRGERLAPAALAYFEHGAEQRSPWPRAMAFASFGAAAVVGEHPNHFRARRLLDDAAAVIGLRRTDPAWPWPEDCLTYANAVLPEAMMAIGHALDRAHLVEDGLALLRWLLDRQTVDGRLSVSPAGGSGPGDAPPRFDQQPIEVAALADACDRAYRVTGEAGWAAGVEAAVRWFQGDNDSGTVMWDPATSGGFDGLESDGVNLNQGTESTLALLSTFQQAHRLHAVPA